MHSHSHDRNKVYSVMKQARNEKSRSMTSILSTPVGVYHGEDILEGFAADAEHLARPNSDCWFDNYFYKLCKLDNCFIFDFLQTEPMVISEMKMSDLNRILTSKMKVGKSCDYYQLTVEHLRNCSTTGKQHILDLLNSIIGNIYYLGCSQIKIGVGSAVYKGKKKQVTKSNSYRRITVSPIIGAVLDYYIDPIAEATFRPAQLDPSCKLCSASEETIVHILAVCPALAVVRQRLYPDLMNVVAKVQPTCEILAMSPPETLTQFILDCTSINLPESFRIPAHNPLLQEIFTISRDWCYGLSNARSRHLKGYQIDC